MLKLICSVTSSSETRLISPLKRTNSFHGYLLKKNSLYHLRIYENNKQSRQQEQRYGKHNEATSPFLEYIFFKLPFSSKISQNAGGKTVWKMPSLSVFLF